MIVRLGLGRRRRPGRSDRPLLVLDDVVTALGVSGECGYGVERSSAEVSLSLVRGSLARADDFDDRLRPRNQRTRQRRDHVARVTDSRPVLTPIELVQVGEIYFIQDGHHRASIAAARGQVVVDARVRRRCTQQHACSCLTESMLIAMARSRCPPHARPKENR